MAKNKAQTIESPAFLDENKKRNTEKSNIKKLQKVKPSFASIAPVVDISNNEFLEMANGEYCEILQISSKDIYSLNATDLYHDIDNLTDFYISYPEAQKIIALNIPLQLEDQKKHIMRKIKQAKNPLHKKFLERRLEEFNFLEKHRTNREYFLFIYDKDEMKLKEKVRKLKSKLSRSNPILLLTLEKKISILFQLSNPNTKPLID